MSCDEFEVQIEMRLHGALPVADELDAHLATCASCRAFESLAKRTEQTMTATVTAEAKEIDWKNLKDGIAKRMDRDAKARLAALLAVFTAQAVAMLSFNSEKVYAMIFPNFAILCAAAIGVIATTTYFRKRRMRAYETSREDLVFFQRAYLEGRLWRAWSGGIILIPFGASYIVFRLMRHSAVPLTEWLAAGMMSTIVLGIAAWLLFVHRPRLARELDAFKKR